MASNDQTPGNLLPQDGVLQLMYPFYTKEESLLLFNQLMTSIQWRQEKIRLFGKEHNLPRLTAWYGDPGAKYKYSGIEMDPLPWSGSLIKVKSEVEQLVGVDFNSVLLNLYRNGHDHVSWHADDEKVLGKNPIIASLSFGGTRKFQLKHRYDKNIPLVSLKMESGSLVVMKEGMQEFWVHRIAKTKEDVSSRINLTFRRIE